jgi:hypothetical protein
MVDLSLLIPDYYSRLSKDFADILRKAEQFLSL